jgi:cytochrome c peroxidase
MIAGAIHAAVAPAATPPTLETLERLGEALFFDTALSKNRTQACATCHAPDRAFTDPREAPGTSGAVSLGDDGRSLGDRNAPTAAYARFSPPFKVGADGKPVGGQFHDGRAAILEDQAGGPPLNPIEMGMPDKASVVARLKENAGYVTAFDRLFAKGTLEDAEAGYQAMTKSLAAFERTDVFAPFDSKYDRYLKGEEKLTDQEELGRVLFFSNQFTNCSQCHKLRAFGGAPGETFSNYQYHNIGTPPNRTARAVNGVAADHVDRGLSENPAAKDAANDGKVKVPTLRNVAVTGPYMHNGVFKDLRTVILFYDKYNSKSPWRQINPETGEPWGAPEVAANISLKELESGPALKDQRIDALVAFLRTLTDRRYEHLLTDRK